MRLQGWVLAFSSLMSACVTIPRSEGPPAAARNASPLGISATVRADGMDRRFVETTAQAALQRVLAGQEDGTLEFLALSGGGAQGAYGAGILVGLSDSGQRPRYEVVTGVSTGALIAPFAFLGPDWDDELTLAYTGGASNDLMRSRGLGALFGAAIFEGEPLRNLVDRFVTEDMLAAIAREATASGRLLLVATTNLDREETVIWNMGAIAVANSPQARRLFREVLVASASVPGVFPPVMIDVEDGEHMFQEMHVDGGASTPFFIAPDVAFILDEPPQELRGARIFVIVNSQLGSPARTTPFNTRSIAGRSFSSVLKHMTRTALAQTDAFARRNSMDFRFTTIPHDVDFGGSYAFEQAAMTALFGYGRDCAARGLIWVNAQQALQRAELALGGASNEQAQCPLVAAIGE